MNASASPAQARDMLAFEAVTKRYADGLLALDGVSLRVPRGQFCVLLGTSGAGKSTLLRTVNGLVDATSGSVTVDGLHVTPRNLARVRPRVAMIHQQFDLVTRASVEANVLAGALPVLPVWRALAHLYPLALRRKACALLDAVGLGEQHLRRPAGELSGGQQQRVGIARAFMLDPPLVLADEPVASLDPRTSRDIMDLLHTQSRERGTTVLCSLHQVDLARAYADRIVALRDGAVVFDGTPDLFDEDRVQATYRRGAPDDASPPVPMRPMRRVA